MLWLSLPNIEENCTNIEEKCTNIEAECTINAKEAQIQRNNLCDYFISPAGELEYQYDYIQRGLHAEK